jgi:carboxylate-amine ligase
VRSVGVEEELLLVGGVGGVPVSVAEQVVRRTPWRLPSTARAADPTDGGDHVGPELQQQQLEIDTPPRTRLTDLEADLRAWRTAAARAAEESGARVVASGTSLQPVRPRVTRDDRYERMVERFGLTAAEQLTCGCHVHVGVESDEEGVAVLDRIRPWLPVLLAISANSPYWQGEDTGYASFRSQAWTRWPSAGPTEPFGSASAYHERVAAMVASGVLLDEGMVYFDARLSAAYPTVEVRATDVCLDVRDSVLVAALVRALTETAARAWRAGRAAPDVPVALLRLAMWQAGREALDGSLLDPATSRPRPAREVVDALVEHVRPALEDDGDRLLVEQRLEGVLARGTGARRQRTAYARTGDLGRVAQELADVTAGAG